MRQAGTTPFPPDRPCNGLVEVTLLRLEHDLFAVVLLIAEHPVAFRRVFERHAMRDDEARIDLALFHTLEQRFQVAVHVTLSGADGDRPVHQLAHRELVDESRIHTDHRYGSTVAA